MDKNSRQTSEITVIISERHSELALKRVWGVYEEQEDLSSVRLCRQVVDVRWYSSVVF